MKWLDRACIIVPALDAERKLGAVIDDLRREIPELPIIVVDDGSGDRTAKIASARKTKLLKQPIQRGKGAALLAGFNFALDTGYKVALTVDADGQHPATEARRVLFAAEDPETLVLGIRDLAKSNAPRANRVSNAISNWFLSRFAGRPLRDTQCGLRRYPIATVLGLGPQGQGFDLEAEVLLRALWRHVPVVEEPIEVLYPADRETHFRVSRDVTRIIGTVVATLGQRSA